MPLTDAKCRSAQSGGRLQKLSDGGRLQLWVQPKGGNLWRFAYRFGGQQKLLAFGVYPSVSLARARQLREDARRLLADGHDPATEKRRQARPLPTPRPFAPSLRSMSRNCGARAGRLRPSQKSTGSSPLQTRSSETSRSAKSRLRLS
jgi:hypothetical protein